MTTKDIFVMYNHIPQRINNTVGTASKYINDSSRLVVGKGNVSALSCHWCEEIPVSYLPVLTGPGVLVSFNKSVSYPV